MNRYVLVLVVLSGVLGCKRETDVYPPDVVRNFVTACTTRSDERVCRCAIDNLQQRFTLERFESFEARMRKGEAPKEMMDAVSECRP